jgi:hypothetical protein
MSRPALCLTALLAATLVLAACDEKLSSIAGPTPTLDPTFSSIQQSIFESTDSAGRTACIQCHSSTGGRTPSSGMSLDHDVAYDNLVNAPVHEKPGAVRVIPGNPEGSYLIQKLEGASGIAGLRMPRNGPPYLTDGQILIIKRWIALGAPRN